MKLRNRLIALALGLVAVTGALALTQVRHVASHQSPALPAAMAKSSESQPGLPAAAKAAPAMSDSHNLGVFTHTDKGFNAALDQEYPGLRTAPGFRDLQSKVVVVRNESAVPVHAFVMKWTTRTVGEAPTVSFTPYMWTPTPTHVLTGGMMLAPGESRLLSPWFAITRAQYKGMQGDKGGREAVGVLLRANASGPAKDSELLSGTLDGAVFGDTRFVGPDESKMADRFECERNGQHDEGVSVARALRANATDEQIAAKLNAHILEWQTSRGRADREGLYFAARAAQAQMLLQILNQSGRGRLEQTVNNIRRFKKTTLQR